LFEGERVLVDASFGEERRRRDFLDLAARLAVPAVFALCRAEPEVVRLRLCDRRGDASDADWLVYQKAAERWEEAGSLTKQVLRIVSTDGTPEQTLAHARSLLRELSLVD
jgi:predicted kinase